MVLENLARNLARISGPGVRTSSYLVGHRGDEGAGRCGVNRFVLRQRR
jgi:hypothetical protein